MSKAAELAKQLESMTVADGIPVIESKYDGALTFDVMGDTMCLMHDDGSVNFIDIHGKGVVTCEVISAENILKVLHHYRPFKEVFPRGLH